MQAVDMDMHVKILVVGNGGVGKSSLLARYCEVASCCSWANFRAC